MKKILDKYTKDAGLIYVIVIAVAFLITMGLLTGFWPLSKNSYNSYTLQALSWLQGRLDLGQNYPHLELAIFNNKYFVSFPPLPSLILLPFALFKGVNTPDVLITQLFTIASFIYAYKIARRLGMKESSSVILTALLCCGSNFVFVSLNGFVWFIAQTMAFAFTLASIYYALNRETNRAWLPLLLLAFAVGCRPLQAVFFPIIMYLIYVQYKQSDPTSKFITLIKKAAVWFIPTVIVAIAYMLLNQLRFSNPLEFGHNYLPEFTSSADGQFSLNYVMHNLSDLFSLPKLKDGKLILESFSMSRIAFYLVNPIVISFVAVFISLFAIKCPLNRRIIILMILCLGLVQLVLISMHKTLGGWHFGNRYTADMMPFVFLGAAMGFRPNKLNESLNIFLLVFGFIINIVGTILVYNKLV